MSIPKTIIQTYKTEKLPLITQWHIRQLKKNNPQYDYQFYDDQRVDAFIHDEYGQDIFKLYKRISIGAAKADFFRYAILYKQGGVYLDIDSRIIKPMDQFILPDDKAVISLEGNLLFYIQFALFYEAGHPFMEETLNLVLDNLKNYRHSNDIHKMTGPTVYTKAIKNIISKGNTDYREIEVDYNNYVQFSYPMSKFFLYGLSRKLHWKNQIKSKSALTKE